MDQLYSVGTGELQGQVCVWLATGSQAEHRPLGKSLKPEIKFWPHWVRKRKGCENYPFKYEAQTALFKEPGRTAQ